MAPLVEYHPGHLLPSCPLTASSDAPLESSSSPRLHFNPDHERSRSLEKNKLRIPLSFCSAFDGTGDFRCAIGFTGGQVWKPDVHDGFVGRDRTGDVKNRSALDIFVYV